MKRRFLLIAALCILVPTMAYSVGEGIREWVWGLGYYIGVDVTVDGNVTSDGTITANSFDSPPAVDEGGSIVLKECETGTSCPAAAAGHTVTLKLPDNANPLSTNKTLTGGRSCYWSVHDINLVAADVGKYFPSGNTFDHSQGLQTSGFAMSNIRRTVNCLYQDSIWVHNCYLFMGGLGNTWTDATDELVLEVNVHDHPNASDNALANTMTIRDNNHASPCSTTTCIGGAALGGTYTWAVQEGYAAAGASGGLGIQLQSKTDANDNIFVDYAIECEVW